MKQKIYVAISKLLCLVLVLCTILAGAVNADSGEYLVLGADLTEPERQEVLKLLDVKDLNDYNVSYVTNAEEHAALGNYLPAEVIGSRALSSIKLKSNRSGIKVKTDNINYVTEEMYQNALITAGLKNVEMDVAGPSPISGTAALTAATKAYQTMTGETINAENADVANEELVVTQDVADEVGEDDASKLVAALKADVAGHDYTPEQISAALDQLESEMNITLTPEAKQKIINLMERINQIDIDPQAIKDQARNIYDQISSYIDKAQSSGFFDSITQTVKNFIDTIVGFFSGNSGEQAQ